MAFSDDELYTACLVDFVRNAFSLGAIDLREKTQKAIAHDTKLATLMEKSVVYDEHKINIDFNIEKIKRIVTKLSLGHLANKLDSVFEVDNSFVCCNVKFKLDFTEVELKKFEELPILEAIGEVGADFTLDIVILEDTTTNNSFPVALWQEVQNGNYRYIAYPYNGYYIVRIVIFETLFAEIIYKDGNM